MTDDELRDMLELSVLALRLKQFVTAGGVKVQEQSRGMRHGVQVWSMPDKRGLCAVYCAIVLPVGMRELPEYLVGLPNAWIASENLEHMELIRDHMLPDWARCILNVSYLYDDRPISGRIIGD